jgi:hypothetical protein
MVELTLIEEAVQANHERRCRIKAAWEAYEGNLPKPLKVAPGDFDDNCLIPLGQVVVNKGVAFLFPEGVKFELETETDGAETEADRWLDKAWKANRFATTLMNLGINGGVCGDVFLRLVPRPEYPRVVVMDTADVDVIWEEDDIECERAFVYQRTTGASQGNEPVVKRTVFYNEGTPERQRWSITEYESRERGNTFTQVGPVVMWPYPWAPIVHCQNLPQPNVYYGYSDLEPCVVGLNNSVNFVETNTGRIIRFHAHPLPVVEGASAPRAAPGAVHGGRVPGQLEVGPDKVLYLPQGTIKNLEMQSDLASSQNQAERLLDRYFEATRVPRVATGKLDSIGQLSGLALKLLYGPLLEKTGTKRVLYGEMLCEVSRRMLEMGGKAKGAAVVIHFPDPLPANEKEAADTAAVKNDLGVSRHTLLQELGYDPETEEQKRQQERETDAELGSKLLDDFNAGREGANPDEQRPPTGNPATAPPNR